MKQAHLHRVYVPVVVTLLGLATIVAAAPPVAAAAPVFPVFNTSEQSPDGVWFRNSPHTADTDRVTGHGVYAGDNVRLDCYAFGDAVGQYGNTLWYWVVNLTRTTVPSSGAANTGYLNAHYVNDNAPSRQVDAGVPACGATPPPAPPVPPASTPNPPASPANTGGVAVMNTSEQSPDGVWFRNSPHLTDTDGAAGHGVYSGDRVAKQCYAFGDAVGRHGNKLWYLVGNLTRPTTASGSANSGYLNGHYIDDGADANQVTGGVPPCPGQPTQPTTDAPPTAGGASTPAAPAGGTTTGPAPAPHGQPCQAFGEGSSSTHAIFGGSETDYDKAMSDYLICTGAFGSPTSVDYPVTFQCTMVAAFAALGDPILGSRASHICDALGFAEVLKDPSVKAFVTEGASLGCGIAAEILGDAGGVFIAGLLAETGPAAVSIGVASARVLGALFSTTCSALFDGGAAAWGAQHEANHETAVAVDIAQQHKCLHLRKTFGYLSWSAAAC